MYTCVCVRARARARVCVCSRARTCVRACVCVYVHVKFSFLGQRFRNANDNIVYWLVGCFTYFSKYNVTIRYPVTLYRVTDHFRRAATRAPVPGSAALETDTIPQRQLGGVNTNKKNMFFLYLSERVYVNIWYTCGVKLRILTIIGCGTIFCREITLNFSLANINW